MTELVPDCKQGSNDPGMRLSDAAAREAHRRVDDRRRVSLVALPPQ